MITENDLIEEHSLGYSAGNKARSFRCKQDVARALGLATETPPDWGALVQAVYKLRIDLSAAREEAAEMQRWAEEASAAENENAKELAEAKTEIARYHYPGYPMTLISFSEKFGLSHEESIHKIQEEGFKVCLHSELENSQRMGLEEDKAIRVAATNPELLYVDVTKFALKREWK